MRRQRDLPYNGWANYSTWNVALYATDTEWTYRIACEVAKKAERKEGAYRAFVTAAHLEKIDWATARFETEKGQTPDGINWLCCCLDYKELDEMVWDLVQHERKRRKEGT